MAKGDYYFPLYYKKLLTSTIGWKDDEFGAYVRLLIHQFDNNNSIPDDLEELKLIAPSVKKNWKRISKKFKPIPGGGLHNEVMADIWDEIQYKKSTNKENGRKGGRKNKPNGYDSDNQNETVRLPNGSKNETEMKAISINNKQKTIVVEPLGSEKVSQIANSAWSDQHWRQQLCIGLNIPNEEILKRWFAQFNSSISNDAISNFDLSAYKKMIRGWILSQQKKGTTIPDEQPKPTNSNYRLKTISSND